jgi:hypothetical protein
MTDALVVLKNSAGADEANVNGVSYARHADGRFYVPEEVAQRLTGTPSGFYRAAKDDHPEVGSSNLEEVVDVIFGLEPGPIRAALIAVLSQHEAL